MAEDGGIEDAGRLGNDQDPFRPPPSAIQQEASETCGSVEIPLGLNGRGQKEKPSGQKHRGQISQSEGDAGESMTIPIDFYALNHMALLYSLSTDLP